MHTSNIATSDIPQCEKKVIYPESQLKIMLKTFHAGHSDPENRTNGNIAVMSGEYEYVDYNDPDGTVFVIKPIKFSCACDATSSDIVNSVTTCNEEKVRQDIGEYEYVDSNDPDCTVFVIKPINVSQVSDQNLPHYVKSAAIKDAKKNNLATKRKNKDWGVNNYGKDNYLYNKRHIQSHTESSSSKPNVMSFLHEMLNRSGNEKSSKKVKSTRKRQDSDWGVNKYGKDNYLYNKKHIKSPEDTACNKSKVKSFVRGVLKATANKMSSLTNVLKKKANDDDNHESGHNLKNHEEDSNEKEQIENVVSKSKTAFKQRIGQFYAGVCNIVRRNNRVHIM